MAVCSPWTRGHGTEGGLSLSRMWSRLSRLVFEELRTSSVPCSAHGLSRLGEPFGTHAWRQKLAALECDREYRVFFFTVNGFWSLRTVVTN